MPVNNVTSREYCFTLNNYTVDERESLTRFANEYCEYLCFQPERGESGTPHLQGYFSLTTVRTFGGCKQCFQRINDTFRRVHLEVTRGTKDQAREYCRKPESRDDDAGFGFIEIGDFALVPEQRGQGSRNDIHAATKVITEGGTLFDVASGHADTFVKFHKGLTALQSILQARPRVRQQGGVFEAPRVFWFYGSTGSGKSHAVYEEVGDEALFIKMPSNHWFDGYFGQDVALFDDFRANWFTYGFLLRVLDKYPLSVEIKGGSVQWSPKTIYITAPNRPEVLYANIANRADGSIQQLLRRITEVKLFGEEPVEGPFVEGFEP